MNCITYFSIGFFWAIVALTYFIVAKKASCAGGAPTAVKGLVCLSFIVLWPFLVTWGVFIYIIKRFGQ